MKRILLALIIGLVAVQAQATKVYLDAVSGWSTGTVYTASSGDSIYPHNGATAKVSTTGSGVLINGVSNVHLFLANGDSLRFDSDNNSSEYGVKIDGGASNIYLHGKGWILCDTLADHGFSGPSSRRALWIRDGHDIFIDSVNLQCDGLDSRCVEWGAFGSGISTAYNIKHYGGTYHNYSEAYTDRQNYQSSVCYTDNMLSTSGSYVVWMDSITIIAEGHIGVQTKSGLFKLTRLNISVDARNRYWDTAACFANGSCAIGRSSANAYGILHRFWSPGCYDSAITITSGTRKYGGRGIMVDFTTSTTRPYDTAWMVDCNVDAHEGHTGEDNGGTVRVLRMRSLSTAGMVIKVKRSTFIGSCDNTAAGTSSIGTAARAAHLDFSSSTKVIVENCRFITKVLSTSGTDGAATAFSGSAAGCANTFIKNNYFECGQDILRFYDADANAGANSLKLVSDTFALPDTTVATGDPTRKIQSAAATIMSGYYNKNMLNDTVLDGYFKKRSGYTHQSRDTNIVLQNGNSPYSISSVALARTLSILAVDSLGHPINGVKVVPKNGYGATLQFANSGADGIANPVVCYWFEENNDATSDDSLLYNNFTILGIYNGDTVTSTLHVTDTTYTDTLAFSNNSGTGGGAPVDTTITSLSDACGVEGDTVRFVFSRNVGDSAASYHVATADSTALAGVHYVAVSTTANFAAGSLLDTVKVVLIYTVGANTVPTRYFKLIGSNLPANYVWANSDSVAVGCRTNLSQRRRAIFSTNPSRGN